MEHHKSEVEDSPKSTFRIEFSRLGVKPPVFIAGTFAESNWQPIEMNFVKEGTSDEYKFNAKLSIPRGEDHQYKFRIGEELVWILNEDEPIVTDNVGNRNNLLQTGLESGTWIEKVKEKGDSEVWEERWLTNHVAEERRKHAGIPAETSHLDETQPSKVAPNIESSTVDNSTTDGPRLEIKSEKRIAENQIINYVSNFDINKTAGISGLVPESPREPSPTPAVGNEKIFDPSYFPTDANDGDLISGDSSTQLEGKVKLQDSISSGKTKDTEDNNDWNPEIDRIHHNLKISPSLDQSTPISEQVPLFSHERKQFPDRGQTKSRQNSEDPVFDSRSTKPGHLSGEIVAEVPSIEIFPTDRASILAKIMEIQNRLPEDEIRVDQILAPNQNLQSFANVAQEHPPALLSITEESESTGSEDSSEKKTNSWSTSKQAEIQEKSTNGKNRDEGSQSLKTDEQSSNSELAGPSTKNSGENTSKHIETPKDAAESSQTTSSKSLPTTHENRDELQASTSPDAENQSHQTPTTLPQPENNVNSTDKTLKIAGEAATGNDGLNVKTLGLDSRNNGTSTGFSGESSRLNLRKSTNRRDLQSPERPITPNSVRSTKKEIPSGNFLKAFWRVVIVEWIGGLIMRFCGRGRRRT